MTALDIILEDRITSVLGLPAPDEVTMPAISWAWWDRLILWTIDVLAMGRVAGLSMQDILEECITPALDEKTIGPYMTGGRRGLMAWTRDVLDPAVDKAAKAVQRDWRRRLEAVLHAHHHMLRRFVFTNQPRGPVRVVEARRPMDRLTVARRYDVLFKTLSKDQYQNLIDTHGWTQSIRDLTDAGRVRLQRSLASAMSEGMEPARAARVLVDDLGFTRRRAFLVARTEMLSATNGMNRALYQANRAVLNGIMYVATLDDRTCLICAVDDRRRFFYADNPNVSAAPRPPRHPACRCTWVPVTKSWEQLTGRWELYKFKGPKPGMRASMFGSVTSTTTFDAWLKTQTKAVQLRVLGRTRFELYSRRIIPGGIHGFVDAGRLISVRELRQMYGHTITSIHRDLRTAARLKRGVFKHAGEEFEARWFDDAYRPEDQATSVTRGPYDPTTPVAKVPTIDLPEVADKADDLVREWAVQMQDRLGVVSIDPLPNGYAGTCGWDGKITLDTKQAIKLDDLLVKARKARELGEVYTITDYREIHTLTNLLHEHLHLTGRWEALPQEARRQYRYLVGRMMEEGAVETASLHMMREFAAQCGIRIEAAAWGDLQYWAGVYHTERTQLQQLFGFIYKGTAWKSSKAGSVMLGGPKALAVQIRGMITETVKWPNDWRLRRLVLDALPGRDILTSQRRFALRVVMQEGAIDPVGVIPMITRLRECTTLDEIRDAFVKWQRHRTISWERALELPGMRAPIVDGRWLPTAAIGTI